MITSNIFDIAIDAVINGDEATLTTLLSDYSSLATEPSYQPHQATLLHYVSANGVEAKKQRTPDNIVDIARLLLEAGANPNQVSNIYGGGPGSTPLVGLVSSSHPADAGKMDDLVRLFCDYGNPNGIGNNSLPLVTAISFRQRDAIRALADCGATINHLVTASATGKLDIVKQKFDTPQPYQDSFGQTITTPDLIREHTLTIASMTGQLEIVRYFVEQGVDLNANASSSGDSALSEAIMGQHIEVIRYLLEHGANTEGTSSTGNQVIDDLMTQYKL